MGVMASQITSLPIVYFIVYSGGDQRTHQSSASLAFVRGIHRWPVNSLHKWLVTRELFPLADVIMKLHQPIRRFVKPTYICPVCCMQYRVKTHRAIMIPDYHNDRPAQWVLRTHVINGFPSVIQVRWNVLFIVIHFMTVIRCTFLHMPLPAEVPWHM